LRNEEPRIRQTLESVVGQDELPAVWVIADDGSDDNTAAIVREYAEEHPFIRLLALKDEDKPPSADRLLWAAEARAFNIGVEEVDLDSVDFVVKLDGDLAFGPDYFSRLLDEFERDATLGIAGGCCYQLVRGRREREWVPESHVRGATKMYRLGCFVEIGGVDPVYGWDTLDELTAQMAGWRTRSFDLIVDHLKPNGSVGGTMRGRARGGRGAYLLGYHPLFMVARVLRLMAVKPYVVGGLAYLWGYLVAAMQRAPRAADTATIDYLRSRQMQRFRNLSNMIEIRSILGRSGD
jgi:poly-beta-1,6-N-acetyl-D-glucosamine synthase